MFESEAQSLLGTIKKEYGKKEFKALDMFDRVSKSFFKWFEKEAAKKRVYCISITESGTLEILEYLRAKGLLTKRTEVRNVYGDEEWYYKLV